MERKWIVENNRERARLKKLVNEITDKELGLVIYKEGWTIAVMLGHLAFWDERRRVMLKIWKQKGVSQSPYIEDIVNDTLIPLLLAIPPRKAAELCIATAESLDKELEELSPEMITAIEALKEKFALNRGIHRKMHLDEIETFLKSKRGRK
jgi:ribosome recycling factor